MHSLCRMAVLAVVVVVVLVLVALAVVAVVLVVSGRGVNDDSKIITQATNIHSTSMHTSNIDPSIQTMFIYSTYIHPLSVRKDNIVLRIIMFDNPSIQHPFILAHGAYQTHTLTHSLTHSLTLTITHETHTQT